jgi:thiamine-monophosphate kinase
MVARSSEFSMIARFFAPLAGEGAYGLTDDAATVRVPAGHELVVTADTVIEGVHFLPNDRPQAVAQKALRVNLSDLAAKGAAPMGYLLALSLGRKQGDAWLREFAHGLALDQKTFGILLIGGDTTATPGPLTITITAFGAVRRGRMIRRAGAKEGDLIFVSGTVGDAGAGLEVLRYKHPRLAAKHRAALTARYRTPTPRLALGRALQGIATAAIDVSDGLIADLGHIAENAKGGAFVIDAARIPLSPAFRAAHGTSDAAIARAAISGDDYEIAFTARPSARARVLAAAKRARTPVTEIGHVEEGRGVYLMGSKGRALPTGRGGFTHF